MNHWKTRGLAAGILGAIAMVAALAAGTSNSPAALPVGIVAAVLLVGAVALFLVGIVKD